MNIPFGSSRAVMHEDGALKLVHEAGPRKGMVTELDVQETIQLIAILQASLSVVVHALHPERPVDSCLRPACGTQCALEQVLMSYEAACKHCGDDFTLDVRSDLHAHRYSEPSSREEQTR
jgi:hypothetical protein